MGALEVLIWILAAIGVLVLLSAIAFLTLLVWIASAGFRRMRDDEATQLPERTDR
ncbi:hypothetical protein ABY45_14635 [Microbacterium maritypicum]|uniref:hypothetical protein n=1 Tax=Microbacterium maritypicum TaxID=33918 RepID=UPI003D6E6C60